MRTPGEDRGARGWLPARRRDRPDGAWARCAALEQVGDDAVLVELDASGRGRARGGQRAALRHQRRLRRVRARRPGLEGMRTALPGSESAGDCPQVSATVVHGLAAALRAPQPSFALTGGLHAAGLFSPDGPWCRAEDVGRHNAVDKLVGTAARGACRAARCCSSVAAPASSWSRRRRPRNPSSRRSAPSSLAVELAQRRADAARVRPRRWLQHLRRTLAHRGIRGVD